MRANGSASPSLRSTDRVVGDDAQPRPDPGALGERPGTLRERAGVVGRVVHARERRHRPHRREARRLRVLLRRVEHLVERVGASIGIRLRRTSLRALPIEIPRRTFGTSRARRRMPLGSPEVQTVIARASIARAQGSHITAIASMTRSTLASGSPIPWKTTPWTRPPARPEVPRPRAAPARRSPTSPGCAEPEAPGRAERARERAPRLRADARGEAPRALERDAHRLDDIAPRLDQRSFTNGSTRLACSATTRTVGTDPPRARPPRASRGARPRPARAARRDARR